MPLEHETAQGRRFDNFAADYDSRTSECPVRTAVRTRLVDIVRSLRPRIVVDAGCGTGAALIALSPSIELGVGLDVSHLMLAVAERTPSSSLTFSHRDGGRMNCIPGMLDFAMPLKVKAFPPGDAAIRQMQSRNDRSGALAILGETVLPRSLGSELDIGDSPKVTNV